MKILAVTDIETFYGEGDPLFAPLCAALEERGHTIEKRNYDEHGFSDIDEGEVGTVLVDVRNLLPPFLAVNPLCEIDAPFVPIGSGHKLKTFGDYRFGFKRQVNSDYFSLNRAVRSVEAAPKDYEARMRADHSFDGGPGGL